MPTAVTSRSHQSLNGHHMTTQNFMELSVAKFLELVPNQSVKIAHRFFTRLEPMPVPTFGDAYLHARWFFVPYRTVMPAWNDFITDASHVTSAGSSSLISSVPYVTNQVLRRFFVTSSWGLTTLVSGDSKYNADILNINANGFHDGYNLTPKGARVMKILQQLGYGIDWNARNTDFSSSALPLLSLAKVYFDWYYPTAYINDVEASDVNALFYKDSNTPYALTDYDLNAIFEVVDRVCYDSDYYTAAWDNPVSPVLGNYSNFIIKDTTDGDVPNVEMETGGNGTPRIKQTYNTTQFSLDALKALNDYLSRHRISGARVLDRYLSRFGVTLDSAVLDRCMYLGSNTQSIDFGNVTSTSDTDGANLGSYAGIGIGNMDGGISFEASEYGMLLCVTSIVPKQGYFQGADRTTMHLTKLDFFTPEFDNLGVQALATRELFMPMDAREQYAGGTHTSGDTTAPTFNYNNLVFGFVPRYAEYKRGADFLTGDYRLRSRNADLGAWNLLRDVSHYFKERGLSNSKHSVDFIQSADAQQYDRIFYYGREHKDTFNVLHLFKIDSSFPGKSLYDNYEFEDEDKAAKVSVDVNGVKAN